MALASLVRGFAHFVLEIVGVAAAVLLLSGSLGGEIYRPIFAWEPFVTVRRDALLLCAGVASVVILVLQYLGRRVAASRTLAAISAATTVAVFWFFLPQTALAVRAATRPAKA